MPKKPVAEKIKTYVRGLLKAKEKRADVIAALKGQLDALKAAEENDSEGRPARYSQELAQEFCRRMTTGETVRSICKAADMPHEQSIQHWRQTNPEFLLMYVRARADQMHAWADQIVHLVDDADTGRVVRVPLDSEELETIHEEGHVVFRYRRDFLEHAKAKADARKWLMPKFNPDDFGEKLHVSQTITYEDKEDGELIEELRTAADQAGVTPEMLVEMMQGQGKALQ